MVILQPLVPVYHISWTPRSSYAAADEFVALVLASVLASPQLLSGEGLSRALWSLGVLERLSNEDYDVLALCLPRTQLPGLQPEVTVHPADWDRPSSERTCRFLLQLRVPRQRIQPPSILIPRATPDQRGCTAGHKQAARHFCGEA